MLLQYLTDIKEARAKAEPLPSGSAPFISSTIFKVKMSHYQTNAKRWDDLFSLESLGHHRSTLKAAAKDLNASNMITLGTARPSPQYFPWESILMRGIEYSNGNGKRPANLSTLMACTKGEESYDLSVALNYGYAAGSPQLLRFVTEHVELIHKPPYEDWETSLTCGTTSAIDIALPVFCNRGDWIIAEDYIYPGTVQAAKIQGLNILGVKMDSIGLLPEDLDIKLRSWDVTRGRKPFLLYMIPSGQNPTGATQTTERRRAVYEVAEQHNLYIIEDDPYYFLQLEKAMHEIERDESNWTQSHRYFSRLPVSYLSPDKSGRVLRLDMTSKIISPGLRCGWITGCSQVIEKFLVSTELSVVSPSGPSQVM